MTLANLMHRSLRNGNAAGRGGLCLALHLVMLLCVSGSILPAAAQEFGLLAGTIKRSGTDEDAYSWAMEYQHALGEHTAVSFSWLNEGHFQNNHRDGQSVQLWTRARILDPRLSLSAGIGPYFYFDTTRARQAASYSDDHGWGAVFSLATTWYADNRWFYQLRANRIVANGSFDTTSLLAGVGYQLEAPTSPGPVTAPAGSTQRTTANELTVYLGRSIVNSFNSEVGVAKSVEYRRGIAQNVDWTVAWLAENDSRLLRRNGAVTQLWLVRDFLDNRFMLGAGAGLYVAIDRFRAAQSGEQGDRTESGIVTATASYRLDRHWLTRVSWNRIVTDYNRDTDVILLGLGYRF